MKSKNIDIYYFSGTGNTFLAAQEIKNAFLDNACKVKMNCMERSNPTEIDLNHTIGIGMTTAYFSTYHFVWDFINKLPNTNGTEIFLFTTMGGFSGGLLLPVKKTLLSKGYTPIGACEFVMPSNLNKKTVSQSELNEKSEKMKLKAKSFVAQLIDNKAKWSYNPILSFIFYSLYKLADPPKRFRNMYKISVDTSKCIQCNVCYTSCPADNIRMYEYPRFEDNCQMCMRCFSYCPVSAISFKNKDFIPYHSAEIKDIMMRDDLK
jgi:ferredoxin